MEPPWIGRVDIELGCHENEFDTGTVKSVIVRRMVLFEADSDVVASEEENTRLLIRTILSAALALATKEVTYCEIHSVVTVRRWCATGLRFDVESCTIFAGSIGNQLKNARLSKVYFGVEACKLDRKLPEK